MANANSLATIEISDGLVEGIIRSQIETALLAAIGNDSTKAMVLDGIVKAALSDKVNDQGNKSQYSSENKHEYLTVRVRQLIQDVTRRVFQEWLTENEAELSNHIRSELNKQSRGIAGELVKGLASNATSQWQTKINVSIDPTYGKDR